MNPAGPLLGSPPQQPGEAASFALAFLQHQIATIGAMTLVGDVSGGPPVAGVITTTIEPLAVETGMIANLAVTSPKIAGGAISNAHVSIGALIEFAKLDNLVFEGSVLGRPLGGGSGPPQEVQPSQLIDIIEAEIGGPIGGFTLTGDVTGGPPVAGVITTAIGALAVTNAKLANSSINNAKVSAIAAIALSKLQFITDGTVVGTPIGLGGSVPTQLTGADLIDIIEGTLGGPIIIGGTSASFFANITDETGGTGKVVGSIAPALTGPVTITNTNTGPSDLGLTIQGATENPPPCRILLVPPSSGTSGGQILTLAQPLLADDTRVFFALGKLWSSTNAAYFGFKRANISPTTNTVAMIGHWGKDDIFKVYNSGGVAVGSASVDPGDTNFNVQGVYKKGNTQVVGARDTGWAAWTSFGNKTTKASNTATLQDCAQTIKSILDALIAHGLIGA